MKYLMLTVFVAMTGLTLTAQARQSASQIPNLDGTYIYQPVQGAEFPANEVVQFPSRNLDGDIGYASEDQLPTPVWINLAANQKFSIRTTKDGYVFTHLPMVGLMVDPDKRGYVQTLVSVDAIANLENTRTRVIQDGFQIGIKRRVGLGLIGGENVEVTVTKKSNGDIEVVDNRTGWALIPAPIPIHDDIKYVLKRLK